MIEPAAGPDPLDPRPGRGPIGAPAASPRRRLALFAILALAAALRLAHWLAVREHPFFAELVMDSREYDRWAQEIAAGDWIGSAAFQAPCCPTTAAGPSSDAPAAM